MTQRPSQAAWYLRNREKCLDRAAFQRAINKDKVSSYLSEWTIKNREKSNAIKRRWSATNKEKEHQCKRDYSKAHPEMRKGASARRRARRLNATPEWLSLADRRLIRKIYSECPKGYEVDHIIPLQGKEVTGLHVPWNLQYLTMRENRAKRNHFNMSGESDA